MPFLAPSRTLILPYPSGPAGFGSEPAQLVLPNASSADIVASGLDLSSWLAQVSDIVTADPPLISVMPTGELTDLATSAGVYLGIGHHVAAWTSAGGIPGTTYRIEIQTTTIRGSVGRFSVLQYVDFDSPAVEPTLPLTPPLDQIMWVCPGLAATGSNLAGAFQMLCVTNIFSIVPTGSGARLPTQSFEPWPVTVQHGVVGAGPLLIYPPDAFSSINGLAPGAPVSLDAPLADGTTNKIDFHYETAVTPFLITT